MPSFHDDAGVSARTQLTPARDDQQKRRPRPLLPDETGSLRQAARHAAHRPLDEELPAAIRRCRATLCRRTWRADAYVSPWGGLFASRIEEVHAHPLIEMQWHENTTAPVGAGQAWYGVDDRGTAPVRHQ
jgi:hypothetical protein